MSVTRAFETRASVNLGSMEIALAISLMLFGVVVTQGYAYFLACKHDRIFLKALALVILTLETAHSVVITHTIYQITVILAGQSNVGPNSYSLSTGVVLETLITALVQSFFAFRIYRLSGTLYISIVCWTLSLLRLVGGLVLAAGSFLDVPRQTKALTYTNKYGWLITLAVSIGAFVDVLVAASMCYYLKRLSSPVPSKRTSEMVDCLMIWIIQTGLITSMASVSLVVTFHALRATEIWFAIYTVLAKLYSNSFFVSLNVRRYADRESASTLQFPSNLSYEGSNGTRLEYRIGELSSEG
ncbi:hypothetical protein L208DRAFT_1435884 [Tricholoma matsutake]|nr:hypothetical protein L208DRAFT_1435884 [Tricholoma matsutake 945]